MTNKLFNLYLYTLPYNDKLILIPDLSRSDAEELANRWYEMNELHDYILVTKDSTPWMDEPEITVKTPEWISLQYAELIENQ